MKLTKDFSLQIQYFIRQTGLEFGQWYELATIAKKLQRLNEKACNGVMRWDAKAGRVLASWTERDEELNDAAQDRLLLKAVAVLELGNPKGLTVKLNGDPRGYALKLAGVSGGFDSDAIWVPYV